MANTLQGLSYALPPNSRILAKEHYKRRRSGNYRIWGSRCATKYGSGKKYVKGRDLLWRLIMWEEADNITVYSYFEKGCRKNVHATIPKGNMGYDQYTVSDDFSCRTYFPLTLKNRFSWPFVPIISNFSVEKWTQNHPQCLSGLSRALFPTTFLEIAACKMPGKQPITLRVDI